jgi:tRNA uridine 5-carboxymethylaminomethyl modification enzyme
VDALLRPHDEDDRAEILYRTAYSGYLEREKKAIERLRSVDGVRIPSGLNFLNIKGLRAEAAAKLQQFQPPTLGHASRISGVNPSDVTILLLALGRR